MRSPSRREFLKLCAATVPSLAFAGDVAANGTAMGDGSRSRGSDAASVLVTPISRR